MAPPPFGVAALHENVGVERELALRKSSVHADDAIIIHKTCGDWKPAEGIPVRTVS